MDGRSPRQRLPGWWPPAVASSSSHGRPPPNVGITSTNESVYFAWQDSGNADRGLQPEDVYTPSLTVKGVTALGSTCTAVAWSMSRRARGRGSRSAPAHEPVGARA